MPSSKSAASFYFSPDPVDETAERTSTLCSFALANDDDGVLYVCEREKEGLKSHGRGRRERKSKMCICAFPCCLATFEFPLSLCLSSVNY